MVMVVVPSALSVLYFGLIESDIYVSECRFVVRQPERKNLSSLGSLLQNIGISSVREEAFTVREYVLSRDALKIIDENLNLRKAFGSSKVDIINRFDPLGIDDSFEALYKYFLGQVTVDVDLTSSIATLTAKAYAPNDAFNINEGLLFMSEGLINKLNDRARKDMLSIALKDVEDAEAEAKNRAMALSIYQDKEILFDPAQQSTMQLQQVDRLQTELIAVRGQIAQYREFAAASSQIRALEKRASELRKEINAEMAKVAGGSESMSQKLIEYERLKLDREFSEQKLAAALTSLEQARAEVQRQQLYLERIVMPNTPDSAIYPRRFLNILAAFGMLFIVYGVVKILLIGVLEHHE
ncbi:MAG: capsule biosynthesis protein [Desulfovibrionaceae bacterium]|nr:capsule biosynthesis protein [Desulfovibrionaceae bacterium]